MRKIILATVLAFVSISSAFAQTIDFTGINIDAETTLTAPKCYILGNLLNYTSEDGRGGLYPGLTFGYLKRRIGVYGGLSYNLSDGNSYSCSLGTLIGLGNAKKTVFQIGVGIACDDKCHVYDTGFLDFGVIWNFGKLSLNLGCGVSDFYQIRIGVGYNFNARNKRRWR